jgi:PAS domain S-box-containing protein
MNENIWQTINSYSERIGAISAIFAALYGLYRVVRKNVSRLISMADRIQTISDQLSSNGGSSLRDAVFRIEDRQVRNEQRERAFLQQHDSPMFELNDDLSLRWSNSAFLKLVGFDSDEAAGFGWHNIIEETDRDRVVKRFDDARDACRNLQTTAQLLVNRDFEQPYIFTATVMRDLENRTSGFFVTLSVPSEIREH